MNEILKTIGEIGVVPVVRIEKADDAVSLGRPLLAGDLPVAEITFRTAAAEGAVPIATEDRGVIWSGGDLSQIANVTEHDLVEMMHNLATAHSFCLLQHPRS